LSPKHDEESKFSTSASSGTEIQGDDDEDDDDDDEGLNDRNTMIAYTKTGETVTLADFDIKGVIGRGTFGKVFLAELKKTKTLYAIKSLRKDILVEAGQVENVKLEKDILLAANHPFLAGMEFVF